MNQLNLSEFMNKKSDYDRTQELREKIKKLFKNTVLRNSSEIELKGGILWGKEVELGENVQVEKGAAILGKTKILKGFSSILWCSHSPSRIPARIIGRSIKI